MMKKYFYILPILFCIACSSDEFNDCFQTEGDRIEAYFEVGDFTKVRVEGEVSLYIQQGVNHKVLVETGENLLPDVTVQLEGETLVIKDNSSCNLVRDYGSTKATVTAPNFTLIRNSSSHDVQSVGVLKLVELSLVSNTSGGIEDTRKGGDFYLQLQCENLKIDANGQSIFYLSGNATKAIISFTDENPRFEGANLWIDQLRIYQVSANKMIVNPREKISGQIRGTGDVIAVHRPFIIEVEELFTGRLLFED